MTLKVEIELSEDEAATLTKACLLRVTKKAVELLSALGPDDDVTDNIADLETLGPVFENVRRKLADAIFKAKTTRALFGDKEETTFVPNLIAQQEPRVYRSGAAKAGPVTVIAAGTSERYTQRDADLRRAAEKSVTDGMLVAAMRAFELVAPARLRHLEKDKWHTVDVMAMRQAIAAALVEGKIK